MFYFHDPETILVPTDFSVHAHNAVKYAISWLTPFRQNLFFSTALIFLFPRKFVELPQNERKKIMSRDVGEKMLMLAKEIKKIYKRLNLKEELTGTQLIGKSGILVVEEILDAAGKNKVALIVTGTHWCYRSGKTFWQQHVESLFRKAMYL